MSTRVFVASVVIAALVAALGAQSPQLAKHAYVGLWLLKSLVFAAIAVKNIPQGVELIKARETTGSGLSILAFCAFMAWLAIQLPDIPYLWFKY